MTPLASETFLTEEVLVDAIVGVGFPTREFAEKAEDAGVARFVFDEDLEYFTPVWDREVLLETDIEELYALYRKIKGIKNGH